MAAEKPNPQEWLSEDRLADGWIALFNGKDLFGWKQENKANWAVSGDVISVSAGESGLLRTTTQFDDFRLRLEFHSESGTNSGVFIRTPPKPTNPAGDCYEINIADSDTHPFPTGSLVNRMAATTPHDSQKWQTLEVTAIGDQISVRIDDENVVEYRDPKPLGKGFVGLQFKSGAVRFRNIFIRPVNLESIFNGKDLSGWKSYPKMDSRFTVIDGRLHASGGRGQLETDGTYADFILQLQCRTNAPGLNSGIFLRCIPGEQMNGYESQIHNGFLNSDRSQPEDCGTGGIFRRQDAREVVANDQEWFHKTIFVEGPHFSVWVNGIQVSDWTDKRKPDANPRQGLRREAGTIMIQGHDPTTDIDFRELKIRELKHRR